jgi:hypothetical protein
MAEREMRAFFVLLLASALPQFLYSGGKSAGGPHQDFYIENDIAVVANGNIAYYFSKTDVAAVGEIRRADIEAGHYLKPETIHADSISVPVIYEGSFFYLSDDKLNRIDFPGKGKNISIRDADVSVLKKIVEYIEYPDEIYQNNISGDVSINYLIDSDGAALADYFECSPHPELTAEVREAVNKANMSRINIDNTCWRRITIPFRIRR